MKYLIMALIISALLIAGSASATDFSGCTTQYTLSITNNNATATMAAGKAVCVTFDHAGNITAGKFSSKTGGDLYIGYGLTELDRVPDAYSAFNLTNTTICFNTQANILAGATSTDYKLYGLCSLTPPKNNVSVVFSGMKYADAFWPFNSNANDYTPPSLWNLTRSNVAYNNTVLRFGQVAYFSGSATYFTHTSYLDNYTRFNVSTTRGITFEYWFHASNGNSLYITNKRHSSAGEMRILNDVITTTGTDFQYSGGSDYTVAQTKTASKWTHKVNVVYPNGTMYAFTDGVRSADMVGAGFPNDGAEKDFFIGSLWNGATNFVGSMDDYVIYTKVMSVSEVQALMNRTTEYPTLETPFMAPSITMAEAGGTGASVTIVTPTNATYAHTSSLALTFSHALFNLSRALYELNGVNTTISGTGGNFNTTLSGLADGSYALTLYGGNSTNYYGSTVSFSVTHPVYLRIISPADHSITTPPYTSVNVSYDSIDVCSVSYYSIDAGSNVSSSCSTYVNITVPTGNHSITVYYETAAGRHNSSKINVSNVNPIVSCSDPGNFHALNFTLFKEEDLKQINASVDYVIIAYYGTYTFNYSVNISETYNFSVCTNSGPWIVDMIVRYTKPDYSTRWYFLNKALIGNSTIPISLYLLNDTLDSTVSLTTQNAYGLPIENVYVSFQRYYIAENLYRTVAMAKSDNEGKSTVSLYTSNTWYKYVLVQEGVVMNTIGPSQITTTDLLLPLSSSTVKTWEDYNAAITRSCSYSSTTKYLTCTFTMTSGLFTSVCLDVDSVGVLNNTDYSLSCLSTSSGTLMSNLSSVASVNQSVVYVLYGVGSTVPLEIGTIELGYGIFFGGLGVFITAVVFCVCAGLGRWNPTVSLIFGYVGLWSCAAIGLIDIPLTAMGSLLVTVLTYIYMVKT